MEAKILKNPFLHAIFIVLLGIVVYSNTFHAPFQLDDKASLLAGNPLVKNLSYYFEPSKAKHFEKYYMLKRRYIVFLTFALNYRIHGLNVTGYHVVNTAIHVLTALLVYFFVRLSFMTPALRDTAKGGNGVGYIALFTSLLFVAHPVQTEAVTYVIQRFASLAAFFYMLSIVCYIKWRLGSSVVRYCDGATGPTAKAPQSRPFFFYLLSLISTLLAMKSKENAFTLPLAVALYEAMFFKDTSSRKRVLYLIPLLLTMLIIPLGQIESGKPFLETIENATRDEAAGGEIHAGISRSVYLLTQFRVIVTYIRLIFFPANQNFDYDYPLFDSLLDPQVFLSVLFLSSVLLLGVILSRQGGERRLAAFGIFFFFLALSVESSVIPIFDIIFEHRVYLPSAGAFLSIATGGFLIHKRFGTTGFRKAFVTVIAVLFIAVISISAYERNNVWKSEISLWEDVARKSPRKYRARNNLGVFYAEAGLADKAVETFQYVIRLSPDSAEGHCNLANAYFLKQRYELALKHYLISLRLKPGSYNTLMNIATAYRIIGLPDEAAKYQQEAIRTKQSPPDTF